MTLNRQALAIGPALLVSSLALGGCAAPKAAPDTSMPPPVGCGAEALAGQTGERVTGTSINAQVGGDSVRSRGIVRIIRPGDVVTQDYNENRLNLELDGADRLARAYCG